MKKNNKIEKNNKTLCYTNDVLKFIINIVYMPEITYRQIAKITDGSPAHILDTLKHYRTKNIKTTNQSIDIICEAIGIKRSVVEGVRECILGNMFTIEDLNKINELYDLIKKGYKTNDKNALLLEEIERMVNQAKK